VIQGISIAPLSSTINGRIITSDDAEYDKARTVFYGGNDRRPAAIVRAANATEVARVIAFARATNTILAVRSGGHSNAGHSVCEGGIVLDLSAMRTLDIDVEQRTVWAETGLTAIEVTKATAAHGLTVGFGDTGSVGIGGITLGGGVGYLVRKYGLTIDSLLAAEIVTADGQCRFVDAKHHPDLFWAIRGGGGNFGVATRFKFQLHPVDTIVGGLLVLPATPDTIAGFIAAAETAPDDLSAIINVMPAPPLPFLPAEKHGQLVIFAILVHVDGGETGQRAVAPFRALATPLADMIRPMRYPEIYPPDDDSYHPTAVGRTMFVDKIDRPVAETICDYLQSSNASVRVAQLRVLGGALACVPADATAFAHRASRIMVNVASFYTSPEDRVVREKWVSDFAAVLQQSDTGAYVNFLGPEGETQIHKAYPGATWDRLVEIKRRYDPTNLFQLNQNIPPMKAN